MCSKTWFVNMPMVYFRFVPSGISVKNLAFPRPKVLALSAGLEPNPLQLLWIPPQRRLHIDRRANDGHRIWNPVPPLLTITTFAEESKCSALELTNRRRLIFNKG